MNAPSKTNPGGHVLRLDLRSLALTRVLFGLALLTDSLIRWFDATQFYSDMGVLPRAHLFTQSWYENSLSLHLISGQVWFVNVLSGFQVAFAVGLILGYQTRICTLMSWILLLSIQNRNPWILDSGDSYARLILFWMLFLPWGQRWSLDDYQGRNDLRWWTCGLDSEVSTRPGLPTFALLLQICCLYWFAALPKIGVVWTVDATALPIALKCDQFVAPLGVWFRELFSSYLYELSGLLVWWEFLGPFFLWFPFDRGEVRGAAVTVFMAIHLFFEMMLEVGMSSLYCLAILPVLFPARLWERLRIGASMRDSASLSIPWARNPYLSVLRDLAIAGLLAWVVFWSFQTAGFSPHLPAPKSFLGSQSSLNLDRQQSIICPQLTSDDGWWVVRGVRRDSTVFNALDPGLPLNWEKPTSIAGLYLNQRRHRWMMELYERRSADDELLRLTGVFLTRRFNGPASQLSLNEVSGIEFYYLVEETEIETQKSEPKRTLVYTFTSRSNFPVPKVPIEGDVDE